MEGRDQHSPHPLHMLSQSAGRATTLSAKTLEEPTSRV